MFSIAIVLIAMLFFYFKPSVMTSPEVVAKQQSHEKNGQNNPTDHDAKTLKNRTAHENTQIMQPLEMNRQLLVSHSPETQQDDQHYHFSFDHQGLAVKQLGDHVQIQMLQFGLNRDGVLVSKDILDEGIVRWRGRFEGFPEDINYFTITQADKDAYAVMKIFTDKGAFVAEIKNGVGSAVPLGEGIGHDEHNGEHYHDMHDH